MLARWRDPGRKVPRLTRDLVREPAEPADRGRAGELDAAVSREELEHVGQQLLALRQESEAAWRVLQARLMAVVARLEVVERTGRSDEVAHGLAGS